MQQAYQALMQNATSQLKLVLYFLDCSHLLRIFSLIAAHKGVIVECVRKYVDGISQNLQSLSPY